MLSETDLSRLPKHRELGPDRMRSAVLFFDKVDSIMQFAAEARPILCQEIRILQQDSHLNNVGMSRYGRSLLQGYHACAFIRFYVLFHYSSPVTAALRRSRMKANLYWDKTC